MNYRNILEIFYSFGIEFIFLLKEEKDLIVLINCFVLLNCFGMVKVIKYYKWLRELVVFVINFVCCLNYIFI